MKKLSFFPRLAWTNIMKNRQFYLPYLLALAGVSASFYIAMSLSVSEGGLPDNLRYAYLSMFMTIGTFVIALFALIFLPYIGGFLMKRRKKDLGLYNILGLGKGHIALMLGVETVYAAIVGVGGGLALGIALQKLLTLLLYKITGLPVYYGFYISTKSLCGTALYFCALLLLNLIRHLWQIHKQSPVELMRESAAGEREPKTRWLLVLVGVLTLGGGYAIAVTARSAMDAFQYYFLAVFLVIIGTYCLFTAVSIAVLKTLRNNKKFYYKTSHFIGISGMLYRMGRNAVGLANICILSTMVLVMVSGTLSLYLGSEQTIQEQFPGNVRVSVRYEPGNDDFSAAALEKAIGQTLAETGCPAVPVYGYHMLNFAAEEEEGRYTRTTNYLSSNVKDVMLVALEDCRKISSVTLGDKKETSFVFYDLDGNITEARVPVYPIESGALAQGEIVYSFAEERYLAAAEEDLTRVYEAYNHATVKTIQESYKSFWQTEEAPPESLEELEGNLSTKDFGGYRQMGLGIKENVSQEYYSVNGGFFFLGLFLGVLFIMAAVLIIYYKQITEGYEDRDRYQIMEKVGLEPRMIRQSINSQILVVFFAPLLVAGIHIAFNYGLVVQLLTLFGVYTAKTTLLCTAGIFFAFTALYAVVYVLTARTYRHIVSA